MGIVDKLSKLINHPLASFIIGSYFVFTAIMDILIELPKEEIYYLPKIHHGILVLGTLIVIRSITELVVNMQEGVDELSKNKHNKFLRSVDTFLRNRFIIIITAVFIMASGITDSIEFFAEFEHDGASSGVMLVLIGISMIFLNLLGIFESKEYYQNLASKNFHLPKLFHSVQLQLLTALVILILGIYEEVYYIEEIEKNPEHRSVIVWSASIALKNILRSLKLGMNAVNKGL